MSYEDRINRLGLRPDRADVIIPAAIILKSIVKLVRPATLLVPSAGLADGVLLDLLQGQNTDGKAMAHQAIAWARSMARKYHADIFHARHVRILARKLFSQLADIHQLDNRDLLLLQISAIVHEIGITVRPNKHHRHAFYLINASPMVGLSADEKKLVAIVVRYHRKRTPDVHSEPFSELTGTQQKRAFRLNILLRLAIALDKMYVQSIWLIREKPVAFALRGKVICCSNAGLYGKKPHGLKPSLAASWRLSDGNLKGQELSAQASPARLSPTVILF